MGIEVKGPFEDIQYAEPLIDEYRQSYSLSALAKIYGCEEKASDLLDMYCAKQGWKFKDAREHIWRMPAQAVARYAELHLHEFSWRIAWVLNALSVQHLGKLS